MGSRATSDFFKMSREQKLASIGNYRLCSKNLGKGTFAKVELATHTIFRKEVALKIIIKSEIKDPYLRKHLYREAEILGRLSHPNVVRLVEICKTTDVYCLVMEYVSGGTLFEYVQSRGRLPEEEAGVLCKQLVSAIAYLHKMRILHRDLKLENILLDDFRVVLVDFGLSNFWSPGKWLQTHCGSAEYASPELFRKDVPYSSGVDVWSFGVVLYAMVIGHLPFQMGVEREDAQETMQALITKIMEGLVAAHYKELSAVSLDCRCVIICCLDVNQDTRMSVKEILGSKWMQNVSTTRHAASVREVSDREIALLLKRQLNLRLPPERILDYISYRRFGTTAGCFNVLKIHEQRTTNEKESPSGGESADERESNRCKEKSLAVPQIVDPCKVVVGEKCGGVERADTETGKRSKSQDARARPGWRRSFHSINPSGKMSFSRLKRVDSSKEGKDGDTGSGLLKALGQRALGDITNSVRPLLRRNSQRETKPPKTGNSILHCEGGTNSYEERTSVPPHIPAMLLNYQAGGKAKPKMKFEGKLEEKETRKPRKPLR